MPPESCNKPSGGIFCVQAFDDGEGSRFNASDFNRIKNNLTFLRDMAIKLYKEFSLVSLGDDRVPGDYFYADEINQLEENLENQPEAVIAVGGGSAIDSSKAIREFALKINNYGKVGLIAIPTTSGTGSEVTSFAVVNDTTAHIKYPLIADSLTADEAILDAELVKSVPPAITADTGMDVFTHALESYVSTQHNEFSAALAEKAVEICGEFLLRAYLDGSDMHARQKMHVASCLAGLSFNTAGLGITHSMAHQLGAMFHIPHGRANAMLLPHIVEFNSDINKHSKSKEVYLPAVHRYANIAHILGLNNYNPVMTVRSLVNWIQFMQKEMNIPLTIQEIGTVTPDEYFGAIDKMADAALADACTSTNPRVPTKEDIMKIYKKLWSF